MLVCCWLLCYRLLGTAAMMAVHFSVTDTKNHFRDIWKRNTRNPKRQWELLLLPSQLPTLKNTVKSCLDAHNTHAYPLSRYWVRIQSIVEIWPRWRPCPKRQPESNWTVIVRKETAQPWIALTVSAVVARSYFLLPPWKVALVRPSHTALGSAKWPIGKSTRGFALTKSPKNSFFSQIDYSQWIIIYHDHRNHNHNSSLSWEDSVYYQATTIVIFKKNKRF